MSVFLYCFREREEILKIFEFVAGQRMMTATSASVGWPSISPPVGAARRKILENDGRVASMNTKSC